MEIDTRGYLNRLLDFKSVFGFSQGIEDAVAHIKDLPSVILLHYIALINLNLYLHDSGDKGQQLQNDLIKASLSRESKLTEQIVETIKRVADEKAWPILFYRQTNIAFYDLIFSNFNSEEVRVISQLESDNIIRAYLILSEIINEKIKISDDEFEMAIANDETELIITPQFIYQRDFVSNVDYTNQVVRNYYFFDYLEKHNLYGPHLNEYYNSISIHDNYDLCRKIIFISTELIKYSSQLKNPILNIIDDTSGLPNKFLTQHSLNKENYCQDESLTAIRNKMFFSLPDGRFLILDINLLIDYLYKAQVFAFNSFLKQKRISDFLSSKAEFFMERKYLRLIMDRAFSSIDRFPSEKLIKKDKNPLADYLIKSNSNILIIEFKDTLLNTLAKTSGNTEMFFNALNLKFVENKNGDPKGTLQLLNATSYLNKFPTEFEELEIGKNTNIFPVVMYTDNTFGYDGINKFYKKRFRESKLIFEPFHFFVSDITFINLSFFEMYEDCLKNQQIDFFSLIRDYQQHINNRDYSMTPFEVYATAHIEREIGRRQETSSLFKEILLNMSIPK